MAILITPTKTTEVSPANGKHFTLAELQGYVEGYIERIVLSDGMEMYVNEDGRLKGLDNNYPATQHLREALGTPHTVVIFGNALVGANSEFW